MTTTFPWAAMAVTTVTAVLGEAGRAVAQTPGPERIREVQEEVARAARPGPRHRDLAALEGEWEWETRIWASPDSGEPGVSRGMAESRMVVDGRFLVVEGRRLEGTSGPRLSLTVVGFDRRYREFTLMTMDTWGTYWVTARGPWDQERGAAVLSGTDRDPILGHTQRFDFVLRFPDPDRWTLEIWFRDEAHTGGEGSFRMVETIFTRR